MYYFPDLSFLLFKKENMLPPVESPIFKSSSQASPVILGSHFLTIGKESVTWEDCPLSKEDLSGLR